MKVLFLLLFTVFSTFPLYSQSPTRSTKTPYEQKQAALFKQYLMDLGFDYKTAQKASDDPEYLKTIDSQILRKMENGGLRVLGLISQLKSDVENAKSLMNSEEKEKDRVQKEKDRVQKEKVAKAENDKKNQEEYLRSDAYRLRNIINDKYIKWSTKGEFEKTDDFQKRMNDKPQEVRNIIISSFKEYIFNMNGLGESHFRIQCYFGNYNPDNESLDILLENTKGIQWRGSITISPDNAKRIKSGARTTTMNGETVQYNSIIKVEQSKCNLAFSHTNIISTKIRIAVKSGDRNKPEYYDIKMTSTPLLQDDKKFFTAQNLQIDMQGNENFTLADVNLACVEE